MSATEPMVIDTVEFPVEEGKLHEFRQAVGGGSEIPLTYVTVAGHWRDQAAMVQKLNLDITRVVVGGTEWEYHAPITVGDRLRGVRVLERGEEKKSMRFLTIATRYERVSDGTPLVTQRDTIIETPPR